MKRPLSPSPPDKKDPPISGAAECPPHPPAPSKPKRERKRPSYTLCNVCNIQLNSAAQAQVHCGGRAHQRRLRQLSLGKTPPGPAEGGKYKRTSKAGRGNGDPLKPESCKNFPAGREGADSTNFPGGLCPAFGAPSPLLASLPLPTRPLQPPLDFKHLLAFHFNGAAPLSLFPNFSTMDPVQKAVISHTFGVPSPLKKKLFISCNICHLRFNSANQAEAHYKGHKHARKLKAVEAAKNKQRPQAPARGGAVVSPTPTPASRTPGEPQSKAAAAATFPGLPLQPPLTPGPTPGEPAHSALLDVASSSSSCPPCSPEPGREAPGPEPAAAAVGSGVSGEGGNEKGHLYCPTCKVTVNSASQLQAHNTGAKHQWMVGGQRETPRRGRGRLVPRGGAGHKAKRVAGGRGGRQGPSPPFHCALCQLQVNSETQLKQHMSSRRHKDRLAGKPPKTSSQHSKLQKHAALAVSILKSKLALQKQLTKTLAARFLPSPLPTAATICALPGPLALRPAPTAATTLFPAPILGPALFRAPVGAVRPATGPIVFAPY
ncbi:zinc finger protein 385C isoform X3 [Choloepus didactylus]|uniref:zinc finger protein 385C isoform X3 n=1 Tax=Choloepus didactylus TaxID=27675 RepID=UPI0018A086D1|nr:zinc finger protein 385C isoform X3 [Choloepus didactylus]